MEVVLISKKAIKFHVDKYLNKGKNDKIIQFLKECNLAQNIMFKYLWNNFEIVTRCKNKVNINSEKIEIEELPRLKSHHKQQILQFTFANLKSIESKIKKKIRFNFDDKEKQSLYNYMVKFLFEWDDLDNYIVKQIKKFKNKDQEYYVFLIKLNEILQSEKGKVIKKEIEDKFYEIKNTKYKCPAKSEYQILVNTFHTIKDITMKEFQWIFTVDTNTIIGGTEKKPIYERIAIPVKFSDYHREKLEGKTLDNTYNIKLNKYGRIEIIASYDDNQKVIKQDHNETIGADIGLVNLITTSDGEIIKQNKNILKKLDRVVKKQSNRDSLQSHLRNKLSDNEFSLPDKNYSKMQRKLSTYVKTDNRYKIKNFLNSRLDYHIVIEDLNIGYSKTKSKRVNYLLKRMSIQSLKNYILDYSKQLGIKVTQVNPAFTSQQCSCCGHIEKANRKTQEKFSCVLCGYQINADVNAAINIKERINYPEIKLDTPTWRIKEILQC